MKERPIIMGAESVKAVLEGRKTQTRRVINPQKYNIGGWDMPVSKSDIEAGYPVYQDNNGDFHSVLERCPYGKVGDRLWVRETWGQCHPISVQNGRLSIEGTVDIQGPPKVRYRIIYGADGEVDEVWECGEFPFRTKKPSNTTGEFAYWKSPMFMPRWASRITLEITDIRVERVRDISEEDAIAEGVESFESPLYASADDCDNGHDPLEVRTVYRDYSIKEEDNDGYNFFYNAVASYSTLWTFLNSKRGFSWEINPWVWVVSFKVVQ